MRASGSVLQQQQWGEGGGCVPQDPSCEGGAGGGRARSRRRAGWRRHCVRASGSVLRLGRGRGEGMQEEIEVGRVLDC